MRQVPHYRPEEGDVHALGCLGERPAPQLLCGQRVQLGEPAVLVCARLLSAHTGQPNRSRAAARSRHQAEGAQPPKLQPPPAAGQESYRPQRSSVPQPSSPLRAGNGLVHPLPLCRDDQLVSLGAVLVVLLDRQPWSVSSSIADRGRPNVSIRRVTISPAARAPAAKASGATWRWVAAAYCVTRTASTTARSVPNTPPRRPNALVPPNSATPRARAVSPTPSMSVFAARSCSAIRTPPRLASADEPRIASVVMPAAPAPRRLAGSATGRNRPTARRTGLAMPRKPPSSASAANAANQYIASLVGLYASSSRTVSACIWSHTITPSAAARLAAHPGTWKPITSTTIATPTAMASSAVTVAATTVPPRSM